MPDTSFTLVDVMQRHGSSATPLDRKVVEETIYQAPVFAKMPVKVLKGTNYKYQVRDSIPMIGPRPYNAGVEALKSSYRTESGECFLYDGKIIIDKGLADSDPEGPNALIAEEMTAHVKGTMFGLELALFYGNALSRYGMRGLRNTLADYMTQSLDPDKNSEVTRAEGGSTVWLLNMKPDKMSVLFGNSKTIAFGPQKVAEVNRQTADGEEGSMEAYVRHCTFHVGFVQKSIWAAARLVNESAAHPLTDEALSNALRMFPAGEKPTHIVMNSATLANLQKSRARQLVYQKKASGQVTYAETPTEFEGIPIIVTDALLVDETEENIAALAKKKHLSALDFINTGNLVNLNKEA